MNEWIHVPDIETQERFPRNIFEEWRCHIPRGKLFPNNVFCPGDETSSSLPRNVRFFFFPFLTDEAAPAKALIHSNR